MRKVINIREIIIVTIKVKMKIRIISKGKIIRIENKIKIKINKDSFDRDIKIKSIDRNCKQTLQMDILDFLTQEFRIIIHVFKIIIDSQDIQDFQIVIITEIRTQLVNH